MFSAWGIGFAMVCVCSFSAPLGILVVPLLNKKLYERVMTYLVAFGIGTLTGSTLFIMIPRVL